MYLKKLILAYSAALLFSTTSIAQTSNRLVRSNPEAEGISSGAILDFVEATGKSKTAFHSFMLLRHGKVVAEGWWKPYRPDLRHTLYSCSKSFTATAIGFAVQEKRLSVDDKVVKFFPYELPDTVSSNLADLSVKDVLMMSDGQDPDPTFKISVDSNWVHAFLTTPIRYDPGTTFLYNSLGTYMLSAIIQKVTGQTLLEYLKPRLFTPLGIEGMDWEIDSKGINTGGWGLRVKTEDMAKFAQLFLQKGNWNGKQILPASWIEEASSKHILQDPSAPQSKRDSSDWMQGYGYQMWRCRNNAFRGDGAYGQYMIIMPEQDAVLAITAETNDMQEEINLVWKYLLPAFKQDKLPENKPAYEKLNSKLRSLALPVETADVSATEKINGKTFRLASNDEQLNNIHFSFEKSNCLVTLEKKNTPYSLSFGPGKWVETVTDKPGPALTSKAIENTAMLYPAKIAGSYAWKDGHTLQLVLRYIESPHTETYTCHFDGNNLLLDLEKSLDFGSKKTTVTGQSK